MEKEKSTHHLSVFISYARADKEFATQLKQILEENDIKVWVDESELKPVEKWQDEIQHAILSHDYFIYIASRSSTAPESFCHQELKFAKQNNKIIVPINIDPTLNWLPSQISDINWINFSSITLLKDDDTISLNIRSDEFYRSLDILLTTLETDLDWVKIFTKLLQKAWEWEEHEQNNSYLLIGDELSYFSEAVNRYSETKPELTSLQQEFLLASQEYDEQQIIKRKRNKKRLNRLLISLSVLIIIACISAFVIVRQNVNRIAGEISNVSGPDIDTTLLLNLQAMNMSDSSEVQSAVHASLTENNYVAKILKAGSAPQLVMGEEILVIGSCTSESKFFDAVLGCSESELQIINLETFEDLGSRIQVKGAIFFISINDKQDTVAVYAIEGLNKNFVYFYDIINDNLVLFNTIEINAWSLSFGPQENQIMIGTEGRIEFLNYVTGEIWREPLFTSGIDKVTGIIVDHNSDKLYSIDRMGILEWQLSDIVLGNQPNPVAFTGMSHSLGFIYNKVGESELSEPFLKLISNQDNHWLASRGRDGIIIWESQKKQNSQHLVIEDMFDYNIATKNMAFIPGTDYLVFAGANETLFIYDYILQESIGAYTKPGIYDINISDNARYFILSFSDGSIIIFDSWLANRLLEKQINTEEQDYLYDFYLAGDHFVVGDGEKIHVYDVNEAEPLKTINEGGFRYALSPNGKNIAITVDGTIKMMDIQTSEILIEVGNFKSGNIVRLFFSPDGDSLYALFQYGLILKLDSQDGQVTWQYQYEDLASLGQLTASTISPNGEFIVLPFSSAVGSNIGLLDISGETPIPIELTNVHDKSTELAIFLGLSVSPNSRYIAFASQNDVIIFDYVTKEVKQIINRKDRGMISAVEFLNNDTLILAFAAGTQKESEITSLKEFSQQRFELYNLTDSREMGLIYQPHKDMVIAIRSLGNNRFISASRDGEIKIWNISDNKIRQVICSIAERELTKEEWESHIGKTIPHQKLCSEYHEAELLVDIDQFDPARTTIILGSKINEEVQFYENMMTGLPPSGKIDIDFSVQNEFEELVVENPIMLQCRGGTSRNQYENDYIIAWLVGSENQNLVYEIEADGFLEYSDGTMEDIELSNTNPFGRTQVWIPADLMMEFSPQSVTQEDIEKIHLKINSGKKLQAEEYWMNNVTLERVSTTAHTNPFFGDYNYPMHSLRINIENKSGYEIDIAALTGLVYDQDGQVIDVLFGGMDYSDLNLNFLDGQTRMIAARSHSITGRCVDFSSPFEPFKIRYFLSIANFEYNKGARWEGEFHSE